MGSVYEIEHELTRHRRALKLLHSRVRHHPAAVDRFLREASAAGRIANPHIIETFDAGTLDSGEPYVVMELLSGVTLADRIDPSRRKRRPSELDLGEIVEIVAQACDGAQAAHEAGIVHRDLKPENLFLVTRESGPFVKLLDFGVSKFAEENPGDMVVTSSRGPIGTPLYMAPEQLHGESDLDGRADIYSLGVILYECASGVLPFAPKSIAHLWVLIHEGATTPLATLRPDLPRAFHDLVERAMAVDRDQRLQTAAELGRALRELGARASSNAFAATSPDVAIRERDARDFDAGSTLASLGVPRAVPSVPSGATAAETKVGEALSLRVASASPPHPAHAESSKYFRYAAAAIVATATLGIIAALRWHGTPVAALARPPAPSVAASSVASPVSNPLIVPARTLEREAVLGIPDAGAPVVISPSPPNQVSLHTQPESSRPSAGMVRRRVTTPGPSPGRSRELSTGKDDLVTDHPFK
jgi:serine/threonine-protein kinase